MLKEECRLSHIKHDNDIKSLSKAQFPGPHCPLFGAIMTASYIDDLTLLVIGTEECTYYGKDFAMTRQNGKDNVYSAVLEHHNITFGCEEDLISIIKQIDIEEKPKALMVITTCVIELIGEDISSILYSLKDEVNAKLLIVKTEHFKCNSHIDGMEKAFSQLALLMTKKHQKEKTVNILGFKYEGIEKTELYKILDDNNINISMTIPTKVTIDELQEATASSLNIVVDQTAVGLAKAMEKEFNIPYVEIGIDMNLDSISNSYIKISEILNIQIDKFIEEKYNSVVLRKQEVRNNVINKTFIYGNTPFDCFIFSDFLVELGMIPIIIQCRELLLTHKETISSLLDRNIDPYIVRMANIAPLRRIYNKLQPDYYFGHESPMELAKHNITQIVTDSCAKKIGFEKITSVIDSIVEEQGIFSLMEVTNSQIIEKDNKDEQVKAKINKLKNIPKPMKKMLLNMKQIPDGMKDAILQLEENDSLINIMKKQGTHMQMRRS